MKIKKTLLNQNGDFRGLESINLLKESDIVVTNPPFSLFREYIEQLVEYDKKFLIIGNLNAIMYKEVFPLIKENRLWLGPSLDGRNIWFQIPDDYEKYHRIIDGKKYAFVAGTVWYTNLTHKKRNEELILFKTYEGHEEDYPYYDNYNAIEVNRVVNIPIDYEGFMGVPITFMNKYNPKQFDIFGITNTGEENPGIRYEGTPHGRPVVNGKEIYARILIRKK